jgi:hypothetical protein
VLERQLNDSKAQRDKLSLQEEALADSITRIDLIKLDMETDSDIAAEIGPLKYIAELTDKTIDQVVNWFIIALMLVFDPLAVALVIAANTIFYNTKKEDMLEEKITPIEFDEDDALDQVLNSMLEDTEEEVPLREENVIEKKEVQPVPPTKAKSVSSY